MPRKPRQNLPGGHLLSDVKYGLRTLVTRDPGSSLIAIVTLSLGIGLTTTTFSLLYGVFFRGLDVPQAEQLRLIRRTNPSRNQDNVGVNQHDFFSWRERQRTFSALASFSGGATMNLSDPVRGPERFEGTFASANLFDVLRVTPVIGTAFRPGDDAAGAPLTVILSHHVWKNRYGADSSVIGSHIKVNGEAATILGVMRPGFMFPTDQLLWVAQRDERARTPNRQGGVFVSVVGRVKDGVTLDQANADMVGIASGLAREYPETNKDLSVRFETFVEDNTGEEILAVFSGMQVATVFVLLIACANVANLLLARATLRTKEAAIRTAMGGSRLRVVLPFFAETGLLAIGGAILGAGIAAIGITLFDRATQDVGKPYYMLFKMDLPILAFIVAVTGLTALAAGAAPALQVLRTDLNRTLKDEGRGSSGVLGGRISRVLVVGEIALSCALLIGAGLMIKSIVKVSNYQYPFATESVYTGRVGLFDTVYPDSIARQQFWDNLLRRLQGIPGAAGAALVTSLPGGGTGVNTFQIEGRTYRRDEDYPRSNLNGVSRGHFATFDVKMLQGREFTTEDNAGSLPVAIVNQAFVEKHFPGVDPIGHRIRSGGSQSTEAWRTIVGVGPNLIVKGLDPDDSDISAWYLPIEQRNYRFLSIAVRAATGDGFALAPAVRQVVRAIDSDLPIYNEYTMGVVLERQAWFFVVFGTLFIAFGAAALFMASVGLYGVLAFSVSRRVREMGIRMAMGATARDVLGMILRQGAAQIAIGLSIGLALALGLTRVIGFIMFDTSPKDPPVFLAISLVIALVGLLASWVPARRATTVDPIVALRYE